MWVLGIFGWTLGAVALFFDLQLGVQLFICALLCHLIDAVRDGAERICRRPALPAEPTIVAPQPVLRAPAAAPSLPAVVPPPLPRSESWKLPTSVAGMMLLGCGVAFAGILCVSYVLAFSSGERTTDAKATDPAWSDANHQTALAKLTAAMSREGFVWRSDEATGGDETVKGNARALQATGEIVNPAWPRLKWRLAAKEWVDSRYQFQPPQIELREEIQGRLPGDVLGREFPGEIGRFGEALPAGAKETLCRLAEYAQQLYDEDHVGTVEEPGKRKGTAQIGVRRKLGPQKYDLTVFDQVGMYRAELVIQERAEPHRQLVAMKLVQPK